MNNDTQIDTARLAAAAEAMIAGAAEGLGQTLGTSISFEMRSTSDKKTTTPNSVTADVSVDVEWRGAITGNSRLVLAESDARAIVAAQGTVALEEVDLTNEDAISALSQAITQLTSGAAQALSEGLEERISLSPHPIAIKPGPQPEDTDSFAITFRGEIADQPGSDILWEVDRVIAQELAGRWTASSAPAPAEEAISAPPPTPTTYPPPAPAPTSSGVIDSVGLDVAVELGNVALTIGELLHLGEGSVVTLSQSAGDDVVLLANGTPVASGEVVVVDGTLGFRVSALITDIRGA